MYVSKYYTKLSDKYFKSTVEIELCHHNNMTRFNRYTNRQQI